MTEKLFTARVKSWLNYQGIYAAGTPQHKITKVNGWHFNVWGGGFQTSGIPDLIICVRGVFVAAELKSDDGKPSDLQKINIAKINETWYTYSRI